MNQRGHCELHPNETEQLQEAVLELSRQIATMQAQIAALVRDNQILMQEYYRGQTE